MQRRHGLRAVERPDMHVVDLAHAGDIGDDVAGDAVAVELGRRAFEQHMGGVAHQRPRRRQDQQRDQHRQDRIDRRPAGRQDDQRRDDRAGRAQHVAEHMQDRAAHVEAAAVAAMQHDRSRRC